MVMTSVEMNDACTMCALCKAAALSFLEKMFVVKSKEQSTAKVRRHRAGSGASVKLDHRKIPDYFVDKMKSTSLLQSGFHTILTGV